jgi:regulator of sirC expression with transglutaminase-like and TPR domain
VAETALALAMCRQGNTDLTWYRSHLRTLGDDVGTYYAAEVEPYGVDPAVKALSTVISELHGYHGDQLTYDDRQNADLIRVIDRRKGLPVSLGLIYMHAARAQGWSISGLNFPGHFLVRLDIEGERAVLDPFAGGAVLSPMDLKEKYIGMLGDRASFGPSRYRPVSDRDVLLRLQNNLKLRYLRDDRPDRALNVLETMLKIAPDRPFLLREAALMKAELQMTGEAIAALERYLHLIDAVPGQEVERRQMSSMLRDLKARPV